MDARTLRIIPAFLALALVASALPATAERGHVLAQSASFQDPAVQSGKLAMFSFLIADDGATASVTPWLDIAAARVEAVQYTTNVATVGVPDTPVQPGTGFTTIDPNPERVATTLSASHARLSAYQPGMQVHFYALNKGLIDYRLGSNAATLDSRPSVRMGPGWFDDDKQVSGTTESAHPDGNGFALVKRDGPLIVATRASAHLDLELKGDLVAEISGLTLEAKDAAQSVTLASGKWKEPIRPGAPGSEVVYNYRQTFMRLFLSDATLNLALDGGSPRIAWAASQSDGEFTGAVTLLGASGRLTSPAAPIDLNNDRHVVPAGSSLQMKPNDKTLDIGVAAQRVGPDSNTIAKLPAPASAAMLGTGAVLALAAAIGVGVLRNVTRLPDLGEVEKAIEAGHYRKAARLAGRIVTRRPDDESALLARGIALTKAGRNERAVREISHRLDHAPASDGSLHYVLGLAQLDLGRQAEAQAALREAVRLTPALHAQVAPRLGKAFSPPAPTTREASGYA